MNAPSKPKGQRQCPALQRAITPQECGACRGSTITCTAECKHNPFALGNEKDFARLEKRLFEMMKDRLFDELPFEKRAGFAEKLESLEDDLSAHTLLTRELLLKHDANGKNLLERWSAECADALSNDERNLLRCYLTMRPALLEVHEVKNAETVEVIDLLDPSPKPALLSDHTAAMQAGRFTTLFAWVYDTPHFLRLRGGACMMDDCGEASQAANLRTIAEHLGCRSLDKVFRNWLADHFMRVCDSIGAVQTTRWQQLMQAEQEEPGAVDYDPELVPPALLERMTMLADEADETDETTDEPADDEEYQDPQTAAFHDYYRSFADRPLALLDGLTPRVASQDPQMRGRLIELMKKHVRGLDQMRREQGLDLDLNPLLSTLGLHEILFAAPPLGEPVEFEEEDGEDEFEGSTIAEEPDAGLDDGQDPGEEDMEDDEDEFDPIGSLHETDWHDLPGFNDEPPPAQQVIDDGQLQKRLDGLPQSPEQLVAHWDQHWPDLRDVALDLTDGILRESSTHAALHLLALLTLALHSKRAADHQLNAPRLGWRFSQELQALENIMADSSDPDKALETYLNDSPQPVLADWIGTEAFNASHGKRSRLSEDEVFAIIPFLKAALWELSHTVS
jgi:hypothetical protein